MLLAPYIYLLNDPVVNLVIKNDVARKIICILFIAFQGESVEKANYVNV